jgi:outer membrane protein TolC
MVRTMREMAVALKAEMGITDWDHQPQFSIGVETRVYSDGGIGSASVGLKMSLPDFNRNSYDAKTYAAQLRDRAAHKGIATTQLEVATPVLTAITEATNSAAQARAHSGEINQKSLQATQAMEGAWISSKSSLTDLLATNRSLFFIRLEQRRFIAKQDLNLLVPNRN